MLLSVSHSGRALSCLRHRKSRSNNVSVLKYQSDAAAEAGVMQRQGSESPGVKFTAQQNYENMRSNLAQLTQRPISGYAGRWFRYKGPSLSGLEADGDIIYGFREKDGYTQVWKAEEGDLDSPKLQKQRAQLPQLQKDPLQLQLKMDALIVEVKADTPLLEPSMTDTLNKQKAEPHPAGFATAMKLIAVPEWGNVVMNGGLPPVGAKDLPPPYGTWFNRLYLRVPGPDGGKRWSVMLHYETATGNFLTHYHNYETAIKPPPDSLEQVFTPGAHKATVQQAGFTNRALGGIDDFYEAHKRQLQGKFTHISWDDNMECTITNNTSVGDTTNTWELHKGGPEAVETWYESGCYFRAPKTLSPEVVAGKDVILEAGVVTPVPDDDSSGKEQCGIARWLLCYSSTGDRRVKWARHEAYLPKDA